MIEILIFLFTVEGLETIKVAIGNTELADDLTDDDLNDLTPFGDHTGEVKEGTTIEIKPNDSVKGEVVVIYVPEFGELAFADVKVYVKPDPGPSGQEDPIGKSCHKTIKTVRDVIILTLGV